MNSQEAKSLLLLYRPGSGDDADPQIQQAMQLVVRDPELRSWFAGHYEFQEKMRAYFEGIEIPAQLPQRIFEHTALRRKVVWWKNARLFAAAAVFFLALGVAGFFLLPHQSHGLVAYRERMVRTALRNYRMNLVTRDLNQIREYLAKNSAPADYVLPPGLASLPGEGCAILSWQGRKVSMVCLQSHEKRDLYLFVINRADLAGAPANTVPQLDRVNKLTTATWSTPDKTYILAGQLDEATLKKFL